MQAKYGSMQHSNRRDGHLCALLPPWYLFILLHLVIFTALTGADKLFALFLASKRNSLQLEGTKAADIFGNYTQGGMT